VRDDWRLTERDSDRVITTGTLAEYARALLRDTTNPAQPEFAGAIRCYWVRAD
jgi:hypothetical protein